MTDVEILRGGELKSGDTQPSLRAKLLETDNPFNLTGYTVSIVVQPTENDSPIVDTTATIEAADRGIVTYDWSIGETDTTGTYLVEFIADNGTDEISFPNSGTAYVFVEQRLS